MIWPGRRCPDEPSIRDGAHSYSGVPDLARGLATLCTGGIRIVVQDWPALVAGPWVSLTATGGKQIEAIPLP